MTKRTGKSKGLKSQNICATIRSARKKQMFGEAVHMTGGMKKEDMGQCEQPPAQIGQNIERLARYICSKQNREGVFSAYRSLIEVSINHIHDSHREP